MEGKEGFDHNSGVFLGRKLSGYGIFHNFLLSKSCTLALKKKSEGLLDEYCY